jgi:hypothetical protein
MNRALPIAALVLASACSTAPMTTEPSLAARPAEAIDPRIPISDTTPPGTANPALVQQLNMLVGRAQSGAAGFEAQQANAERLAATAGAMASESWIAAQQSLSLLVEQHGIATRAAADIDELASSRLIQEKWIRPADQAAIAEAAAQAGAITSRQAEVIRRLQDQLAR